MALFSVQDKCYNFRLVFTVKLYCIGRCEKLQLNIITYLLSVTEICLKSVYLFFIHPSLNPLTFTSDIIGSSFFSLNQCLADHLLYLKYMY